MKVLIVGIDGLGWESLEALGLQKLETRIFSGKYQTPSIDNVVSRGWPEIYTGKNAYQTGAFYQAPEIVKGRITPTQKTGLSHIKSVIDENDLLWNKLMAMGHRTSFFGVPTVSTTEALNGFSVAATGGGEFGNSLSREDVYPADLFEGLNLNAVDLGLRMGYGAFLPDSLSQLEEKAAAHLHDYFSLLRRAIKSQTTDALFIGTRFINEMAYKFIELCKYNSDQAFDKELRTIILNLCSNFDELLDEFVNEANAEHLFIVSDHGIGVFEYDLNLNQILVDLGYLEKSSYFSDWKNVVRPSWRCYRRMILRQKVSEPTPYYNLTLSKAYSIGFTNVIYVNETLKEYEPIEKQGFIEELLHKLNGYASDKEISQYIKFLPIENNEINTTGFPLPDIKCEMKPGVTNTERKNNALQSRAYDYRRMFSEGFYGEHSGCKIEDTIAAYAGPNEDLIDMSRLTTIYDSILRVARECSV